MTRGKGRNPGAGNLGKHIKRTVHKERSQPAARRHLGPLEKHKDHVLRARRRKEKMKRLLQLKRAAAQRNPDEFHIGMTKAVMDIASGKMKRRAASKEGNQQTTQKVLRENIRNVQYLQHKAQTDLSRAKELLKEDASATITSVPPRNKHIVFVETDEEFSQFDPVKYFDTTEEMLKLHPARRGSVSIMQNTVLPEEVLLAGPKMLSASQRRREHRKMREKQRRGDVEAADDCVEIGEEDFAKKDTQKVRFSSLLEEAEAEAMANGDGIDNEDDDVEDDAERVLQRQREKEQQDAREAARRIKEIQQRVERSRNLQGLAKQLKKQNNNLRRVLERRRNARFKPNAARRAR